MPWESFESLIVYKSCRLFRINISQLVKDKFPKKENYSLTSQIIRSSRSVTANIAEGHGRFHIRENIQFCRISRGSLTETLEHLYCALDEKYISEEEFSKLKIEYDYCLKLLNGYIKHLKSKK
jgi:four helix bundle protein